MNPRPYLRRLAVTLAIVMLLGGGVVGRAAPAGPAAAEATGGFVPDDGAANGAGQSGGAPSLAFGSLTGGGALQPWLAFTENNRVVAATFNAGAWQRRGGALNFGSANSATHPSADFSGPNRSTPWAAFVETIGGKQQILAAKFDGTSWQRVGNGTPPSLNISAAQNADNPALAGSGTLASATSAPWVAWDEATAGGRQVYVKRLVGAAWQQVGAGLDIHAPTDGSQADIAFAGAANDQPWVVWQEQSGNQPGRIFAARTSGDGQGAWTIVGRQASCTGAACALNLDAAGDASMPQVTAGALPDEAAASPWVVFAERAGDGARQVFVARLHPTDSNRFVLVGNRSNPATNSLNTATTHDASDPDIFFVGNVPHVSWTEQVDGVDRIFVSHLADARPGFERWDLDTDSGINRSPFTPSSLPAIGSAGSTPFVAWQEGVTTTSVFAAHRYPDGPAWGRNYPPFIRIISGTIRLAAMIQATDRPLAPAVAENILGPATITTSCDHVNGWDQITDVQLKLSNAAGTIFLGKYVAAENKFYVEDPAHPGTFLPPSTPGSGPAIETANVLLDVPQMSAFKPGSGSAVVDMQWVLYFKRPTFLNDYVQSIDIGYNAPPNLRAGAQSPQQASRTGFFGVGTVSVGARVALPLIVR